MHRTTLHAHCMHTPPPRSTAGAPTAHPPAPSPPRQVLRVLLRDEPLAADVDIASIASATEGYSGSDLEQARACA